VSEDSDAGNDALSDAGDLRFGDDRTLLGTDDLARWPRPRPRLVFVDGREVIWRSHNRGLVEWGGYGSPDDNDVA
jgi:hypothetical protein